MARKWLWHCGWELLADSAIFGGEQDIWNDYGYSTIELKTDTPRLPAGMAAAGKAYFNSSPTGFSTALSFVGHAITPTQDYIYWVVPMRISAWGGGSPTAGDQYLYARLTGTSFGGAGGTNYLGMGFTCAASPTTDYFFSVRLFNSDGTLNTANVIQTATQRSPSSTWHFIVIEYRVSTKVTKMWVNGTQEGSSYTPAAAVQATGLACHDNRFIGGKGADKSPVIGLDDWGCAEGLSTDLPPVSTCVTPYQMDGDIDKIWTPSTGTDHYRCIDDGMQDGSCPTGTNLTPGAASQRDSWTVKDAPSGTIEAVRPVWKQDYTTSIAHTLGGRINPTAGWIDHVAPPPSGHLFGAGYQYDVKPGGGAWSSADLNSLELSLLSIDTKPVYRLHAMGIGTSLERPADNSCAAAARRRFAQVV